MISRKWPALRDWTPSARPLATRRAVYGKVHRAPSDYRWIGWSAGFGSGPAPLENELALGSEDSPASFFAWRSPGAIAVKCYRSRAFDAAGRPGGVEKQVLAADDNGAPAAVLAFLLLAAAEPFEDSVWWESWRDPRWTSLEFYLPIPEEQCPVLAMEKFDPLSQQGIGELLEAVPGARLEDFYAQLLAGQTPVIFPIAGQPLPPLALAALLLPLDPPLAARVSFAGGFPSRNLDPARLSHWSAIACPPDVSAPEVAPPREFRAEAAAMVRLLERGRAASPTPLEPREIQLSDGGSFLIDFLESPERWIAPGERGSWSLTKVGPWRVVRHEDEADLLRDRVRRFAAEIDAMPDSPAKKHLATKVDLLRAMLLVLCPGTESIEAAGLPATGRVPALYFAGRIESPDWPELGRYSAQEFATLARHSLEQTVLPAMVRPVAQWLEVCAGREESGKLGGYARMALRHFGGARESRPEAGAHSAF